MEDSSVVMGEWKRIGAAVQRRSVAGRSWHLSPSVFLPARLMVKITRCSLELSGRVRKVSKFKVEWWIR